MLEVTYIDKNLRVSNHDESDNKRISRLWYQLSEDYTDLVSSIGCLFIDNKTVHAGNIEWMGMSTWWINPIAAKDVFGDCAWINRLMVLYLIQEYQSSLRLVTDDQLLVDVVRDNFTSQQITQIHETSLIYKTTKLAHNFVIPIIKTAVALFRHVEKWAMLARYRKKQIKRFKQLRPSIWIRSLFSANWMIHPDGYWYDRHYSSAFRRVRGVGRQENYLVYIVRYAKDKRKGFVEFWKSVYQLEKAVGRPVAFVEAHIRLSDIFSVFWSTYRELCVFKTLKGNSVLLSACKMNGLDVSRILLDLWGGGYAGVIQSNKLNGIALRNFFKVHEFDHTVVTYGEMFYQNRAGYHLLREVKPDSKIVALQHAMNVKYKLFSYHRKSELECSETELDCYPMPHPDFFLVQGRQYKKILEEFYPENRIELIGSLKYDSYGYGAEPDYSKEEEIRNKLKVNNERLLLLLPSTGDHEDILDVFSSWEANDEWVVVLCPHPATDINLIRAYQEENYPWLSVRYEATLRTNELISYASLVISGFSTTAIEALFFRVRSVRFMNHGTFPLFEHEEIIPVFYDTASFMGWFTKNDWDSEVSGAEKQQMDELIERYFYKNDGRAADRMWEFLKINPELPHNKPISLGSDS